MCRSDTHGRENPLADFLCRMNQDQNCPIFQKMQHQLQETQTAGTTRSDSDHSQAFVNNRAQRQRAANADNRSVNLATSANPIVTAYAQSTSAKATKLLQLERTAI